eukprot:6175692-Pleurochrysis_carterae.AAC.2
MASANCSFVSASSPSAHRSEQDSRAAACRLSRVTRGCGALVVAEVVDAARLEHRQADVRGHRVVLDVANCAEEIALLRRKRAYEGVGKLR